MLLISGCEHSEHMKRGYEERIWREDMKRGYEERMFTPMNVESKCIYNIKQAYIIQCLPQIWMCKKANLRQPLRMMKIKW
jgi:hypothetical protein